MKTRTFDATGWDGWSVIYFHAFIDGVYAERWRLRMDGNTWIVAKQDDVDEDGRVIWIWHDDPDIVAKILAAAPENYKLKLMTTAIERARN